MMTARSQHESDAIVAGVAPARLEVNAIYQAARLVFRLSARIRMVLPSIAPCPLWTAEPPVCKAHDQRPLGIEEGNQRA